MFELTGRKKVSSCDHAKLSSFQESFSIESEGLNLIKLDTFSVGWHNT